MTGVLLCDYIYYIYIAMLFEKKNIVGSSAPFFLFVPCAVLPQLMKTTSNVSPKSQILHHSIGKIMASRRVLVNCTL